MALNCLISRKTICEMLSALLYNIRHIIKFVHVSQLQACYCYNMHVKKMTCILQDYNMCTNMHVLTTLEYHACYMHVIPYMRVITYNMQFFCIGCIVENFKGFNQIISYFVVVSWMLTFLLLPTAFINIGCSMSVRQFSDLTESEAHGQASELSIVI